MAVVNDEDWVWQMSVDGSSGEQGSGAGIVLESPEGEEISYAVKLEFTATNKPGRIRSFDSGVRIG